MNEERLLITSPKALAEVLTTKNYDFEKPHAIRFFLGRILGIGLFFAEGDEHKAQRRKLMPAFAFRHVKDLYSTFWAKSQELVQGMTDVILSGKGDAISDTPEDGTVVVEVGAWASRATLDIIGVAGLGHDFGALQDPNNKLSRTYNTVFQPNRQTLILGLLNLVLPTWILDKIPLKRNNDIRHATGVIRDTCRALIQEKKLKLARKEQTDVDILSVALESGGFTDENLVDQMMTFLLAGHETTASSMTWAAYLLAKHPDIQAKLRAEVRSTLPSIGDTTTTVSSLDIDRMPYLHAFCSEVFRYFPPAAMLTRDAARDTSIQGHHVPKGTRIILCPWAVNRSESIWGPDAGTFNPDRWLDGGVSAPNAYGMMTFLHGPRACIGREFAKAEFACLMAAWAGRFSFELHDKEQMDESKVDMQGAIITRPVKGMYIKMTVIEGW